MKLVLKEKLTVYYVEGTSRWQLISALFGYWLGTDAQLQHVTYFETTSIEIRTDPIQRLEIDGELKAETPVRVRLAPAALKVIVPDHFRDQV